jgi:hypothetical protein
MEVRRRNSGGEMAFGLVQLGLAVSSLRDAEMSYEVVDWLANNYWFPNMATTHNPKSIFNTDLSGGLPAIIIKMLAFSDIAGTLDLLPACPRCSFLHFDFFLLYIFFLLLQPLGRTSHSL